MLFGGFEDVIKEYCRDQRRRSSGKKKTLSCSDNGWNDDTLKIKYLNNNQLNFSKFGTTLLAKVKVTTENGDFSEINLFSLIIFICYN